MNLAFKNFKIISKKDQKWSKGKSKLQMMFSSGKWKKINVADAVTS